MTAVCVIFQKGPIVINIAGKIRSISHGEMWEID